MNFLVFLSLLLQFKEIGKKMQGFELLIIINQHKKANRKPANYLVEGTDFSYNYN
jgi:hypothetical protein